MLWRVPSSKQLDEVGSTPRRLACHLQCYGLLRHLHGYRCSMYNGWQLGLASADSEASFAGGGWRIKCTRVSRHLRIVVETSLLRRKLQLRNASCIW